MACTKPIGLRWPPEFVDQIDEARGLVSRAAWLKYAAELLLARENAKPAPEPQETHA